jgi:hypothetical protein
MDREPFCGRESAACPDMQIFRACCIGGEICAFCGPVVPQARDPQSDPSPSATLGVNSVEGECLPPQVGLRHCAETLPAQAFLPYTFFEE